MSLVDQAFGDDPELAQRIRSLDHARLDPQYSQLFQDITHYVLKLRGVAVPNNDRSGASKKRKLDNEHPQSNDNAAGSHLRTYPYSCDSVSVAVPVRKKLKLQFCVDAGDASRSSIDLINTTSNAPEYSLTSANIEAAFCLPVPDKQARQWNFVVIPVPGAQGAPGQPAEQLVFTLNEPKSAEDASTPNDITSTETHLNALLRPFHKQVVRTSDAEFHSAIPQPHRKNEKAYHVSAHRGSKEGYLFFLPNGIVFGFKKPLAFFPFAAIESISYTSVLQRTFNLVVAASEDISSDGTRADPAQAAPAEVKEVEFSMLDQADFAGIDAYVKKHGLNDASMVVDCRAKAYHINKDNKKVLDENGDVVPEAGDADGAHANGEAEVTEQQLQDEEDELEEDYEASGGKSDGEGEYSEEDEDGGEGDGYEGGYEEGEDEGEGYDDEGDE